MCIRDRYSEEEIRAGIRSALRHTHNLAEGAGVAALAAAKKLKDKLAGQNVAMIMSGGNLDMDTLKEVLTDS